MKDEKVLIALGDDENAIVRKIFVQYDLEINEINTRSKLLTSAQNEKPLIIILNISSEDGIGGAAVGEAIMKVSPDSRIIFVGKDDQKLIVDALYSGDAFIYSPIRPEIAEIVIKTNVVKSRVNRTGRIKYKDKTTRKAQETQAMHNFVLQLSNARRMNEFAQIIMQYLREMLDFKVFVFSIIEKQPDLFRSRIYLTDDVNAETLANIKNEIKEHTKRQPAQIFNFEFVTQDETNEIAKTWDANNYYIWELSAQSNFGCIFVFSDVPLKVSAPMKKLTYSMFTQASTFISYLRELETERIELLNTITNIMPEGVLWIDDRKTEVFVNNRAKEIFDKNIKESISTTLHRDKLFDIFRRLNIFDNFFGLNASKKKNISNTLTINGFLLEFNVYRITQGDSQEYTGTLFVIRDKTEEKNEAQENFELLNVIINEIKEPVKSIDALSELVYDNLKSQTISREYLRNIDVINDAVNKISEIVNYFVNKNKLKYEILRKKPVKVENIFDAVFDKFRDEAASRNITLKKEVLPGGMNILADAEQIQLVLKNLVMNSMNYTADSGIIILRSEPSEYAKITKKGKIAGIKKIDDFTKLPRYFVEISCIDNGIGIPEDHHIKVFERFAQAETPQVTGKKGIGLGLTLAQNIIEFHGGNIWIDHEYKDGAKVVFNIAVGFALPKDLS
ncbi:MAG: PAS domain-containing sensor histidine kinase [Planctomycetes bacterium]|nr:PAS domain-containing sensor histidine kinase [Planctomycetota bacterium]